MYFRKIDKMVKLWNTNKLALTTLPVGINKNQDSFGRSYTNVVILAVRHISLYHNLFVCNDKLMYFYILR